MRSPARRPSRARRTLVVLGLALALTACGVGSGPITSGTTGPSGPAPTAASTTLPRFSHVFIIILENEGASAILGNSQAPYVNSLAGSYALAESYYAVSHPSLPNYISLTAGTTAGLDGTDCSVSSDCHVPGTQTNIADELEAAGHTWIAYMESMPQPCSLSDSGVLGLGSYAVRHNPFVYFDDIRNGPNNRCATHDVPYNASQFDATLASGSVPDFVWITPNLCNDGHDACGGDPIAHTDAWLAQNAPPILDSQAFQQHGVLFITWDEGADSAACCGLSTGGGRVATVVVSPLARGGYQSKVNYDHYSLLRTIEDSLGLGELGNTNPATQPGTQAMTDLFSAHP